MKYDIFTNYARIRIGILIRGLTFGKDVDKNIPKVFLFLNLAFLFLLIFSNIDVTNGTI